MDTGNGPLTLNTVQAGDVVIYDSFKWTVNGVYPELDTVSLATKPELEPQAHKPISRAVRLSELLKDGRKG